MLQRSLDALLAASRAARPGFRVQGSGFRAQGSGFRVQGSGFRVQVSGTKGPGFRVQGSGFRVQGGYLPALPDEASRVKDAEMARGRNAHLRDSRPPDASSPDLRIKTGYEGGGLRV